MRAPSPFNAREKAIQARAVIVDLDGTLNDCVLNNRFDFDNYQESVRMMDIHPPNRPIIELVNQLHGERDPKTGIMTIVLVVTARPDRYRGVTHDYLHKHGVHYDALFMRENGDTRPDAECKRAMIPRIKAMRYRIWFAIEDRNSVVAMWRSEGITCLQCKEGNY